MADTKKENSNTQQEQLRENVDFGESVSTEHYRERVSNTLPAPPNPHRDEWRDDKKE